MKTNTALLILIGALLVGGGIMLLSDGTNQTVESKQTTSSSLLTVDRQMHDFGEVDIFSGVVTTTFALTNGGPDDVVVTEGTTSCGCTNAALGGISFGMHEEMNKEFVILAGETKELTVIYDPLAHGPSGTGLAQRSVFLKTNASATPELEVRIKALVVKTE
ncbi:DUF1573 domain-containing protein [Candidatus Kaiserbacteria bacterium]|nr:MAG: DUF1573 domain-containing protein [Candidatus Kaiserbacteria bacterium]